MSFPFTLLVVAHLQVVVEALNTVAGRQSLLQQWGELLRKLLPVVVPDLLLKAMQDLVEHVPQVILGVDPGRHRITEEDPAPPLLGSRRSSCRSHGTQSPSPRCPECYAETYTTA
ncbi:hypothetical protein NHX12_018235 [Muraenolepis orangiensis]|uniref:Secreted protein n=1 Tax=Muraenolepis orangiensis TaxID=630683 RepID=A0A9Q0IXD3_9TELE|nr:hypothetical protein NHX12_018235 [Muraenolepis orangiensis]